MRCYLMRGTRIANVAFLHRDTDDQVIRQGMAVFENHADRAYDGFEVWDGKQFIYRFNAAAQTGERCPSRE